MPEVEQPTLTVGMIIQRYHPHVGGAERQLQALGPRLLARGIRPVVLTRRLPGTPAFERLDGLPVTRIPAPGPKAVAGASYVLGGTLRLWRWAGAIDLLHAHELLSPATIGLLAGWLSGRPLLVKVLRGGALSDLRALAGRPLGRLRWWLARRRVDRFIAVSGEIERELRYAGVPPDRVCRIPNGVDVERFRPVDGEAERSALRAGLGLADRPTAIYAGRLAPEKRVDALARVWPRVRRAVPGAQLLVVGDGPARADLERAGTDGLLLLGERETVEPWLRASDVFALPSLAEGLSNAMLEAMACGLACVVRPDGGAPDAIRDGESGLFLPDLEDDTLAARLVEALDETVGRRLGLAARERACRSFSLDATADRLAALYRSMVARPRAAERCAASPA